VGQPAKYDITAKGPRRLRGRMAFAVLSSPTAETTQKAVGALTRSRYCPPIR
jgi:hypothetical protein